ncbi:MAG: sugar phosphate isomerase/epimerase [Rubellimicrobium sp.]|nr:sugar phosphate isomerase/epimerase [Rubellimicrobium sp.]
MRLSLAAWSFPSLTLPEVAAVARAIGVAAIDIGIDGRAALSREGILTRPERAAADLAPQVAGLGLANLYYRFGAGLAERNLAAPGTIDANRADLERVLTFADAAGIATVFILPGIVNPGQSRDEAARAGIDSLRALAGVAAPFRARLCFEPHVQSWCESPALALRAARDSGVGLALDHAHFVCLGLSYDFPRLLCDKGAVARHPKHAGQRRGTGREWVGRCGPCGSVIAPVFSHDLNG